MQEECARIYNNMKKNERFYLKRNPAKAIIWKQFVEYFNLMILGIVRPTFYLAPNSIPLPSICGPQDAFLPSSPTLVRCSTWLPVADGNGIVGCLNLFYALLVNSSIHALGQTVTHARTAPLDRDLACLEA